MKEYRTSIGQDSHRFSCGESGTSPAGVCLLGGIAFPGVPPLAANSDGDVVLHALTNAVSGITCHNILGGPADELCRRGITDSAEYLRLSLADLHELGYSIVHISIAIECARPKISPRIPAMREKIASITDTSTSDIGITATSGEGLTGFGRGEGISVFCILTVSRDLI